MVFNVPYLFTTGGKEICTLTVKATAKSTYLTT